MESKDIIYNVTISPVKLNSKPQTKEEKAKINKNFITTGLTINDIVTFTTQPMGYTIAPAVFSEKRKNEYWTSQSTYMLDFDKGITEIEVLNRLSEFNITPNFIYYTFSHKPEAPRFRIGIMIDEEIKNYDYALTIRTGLLTVFPEADQSCKDAARMYFGGITGKVLSERATSLQSIVNMIGVSTVSKDGNQTRKIAEKRDILYDIYSTTQKNAQNTPTSYIISPLKRQFLENVKSIKFDLEKCKSTVRILKDFDEGVWLNHPMLFGLATNLLWIKGGLKYMKKVMEKYNEKGMTEYSVNNFNILKYVHTMGYNPKQLQSFSPFVEDYKFRDLIDAVYNPRGHIQIVEQELKITLDEAEQKFNNEFNSSLLADDNRIYLFKTQTGLGKSTKLITLKNVTLCFSTHSLKNEIFDKMKVECVVTPEIPKFESQKLNNQIRAFYDVGLNNRVYSLLKSVSNNISDTYNNTENDSFLSKDYLMKTKAAYQSNSTVLSTHQRGLFDLYKHNTIIFDEDPLKHLIVNKHLLISDLMNLESSYKDNSIITELIDKLRNSIPGQLYPIKNYKINKYSLAREVANSTLSSNVLEFFSSLYYIKDETNPNIIYYVGRRDFPSDKKIIILSATAPIEVYQNLFGERLKVIDISNIQNKGEVIQHTSKSYSQYSISRSDTNELKKKFSQRPLITFKSQKELLSENPIFMHFGNCEGYDELKGKDIDVIGTPHKNSIVYLLYAAVLGIDINQIDKVMKMQRVEWNGFIFKFMTYSDLQLQRIQLGLIESELIQAIGRARPLRTEAKVHVYSNLPLRICDKFES